MVAARLRTAPAGSHRLSRHLRRLAPIIVATLLLATFPHAQQADAATVTIWGSAAPSAKLASDDTHAVTLGTRILVRTAGKVRAIRVYKGTRALVAFQGYLWDSTGRQLARVGFKQTRATGWLEAKLSAPVALRAGQTYTVGYRSPIGRYVYAHDSLGGGRSVSTDALTATAESSATPMLRRSTRTGTPRTSLTSGSRRRPVRRGLHRSPCRAPIPPQETATWACVGCPGKAGPPTGSSSTTRRNGRTQLLPHRYLVQRDQ